MPPRQQERRQPSKSVKVVYVGIVMCFMTLWLRHSQLQTKLHYKSSTSGRYLEGENAKPHILVTGGAGLIGSHAALKLLEDGYAVTIVDNLSRGNIGAIIVLAKIFSLSRFHFVMIDLGNSNALLHLFQTSNFKYVMHFAGVTYVGESIQNPLQYYNNITINTINLLETMKIYGVQNLVYSSSGAVYGSPLGNPVTENTPPNPVNPYGHAKLSAEKAIRDYSNSNKDFKSIIFRYFNVYGSDPGGRLGEFTRLNLKQFSGLSGACIDAGIGHINHITIKGTKRATKNGTYEQDYVHVQDLVSAHILGLKFLSNPPNLFNVGTGQKISIKKFILTCKSVTGQNIRFKQQNLENSGDYLSLYSNISKIKSVMKWEPQFVDLQEGLTHAWKWRLKNPYGYPEDSSMFIPYE